MFGLFKKKQRQLPSFKEIEKSDLKDKYFIRLARWDWLDAEMIHVTDNHAPRMITMDPWPQLIYLEADGQKTVYEFVYYMASQYGKNESIPEALDSTIIQLLNNLVNDRLISLCTEKKKIPYYLELPRSKQDLKKAEKSMLEDGIYIDRVIF
jgi:hypothetical protein